MGLLKICQEDDTNRTPQQQTALIGGTMCLQHFHVHVPSAHSKLIFRQKKIHDKMIVRNVLLQLDLTIQLIKKKSIKASSNII
jgi:hypothetical protein